MPRIIDNTLWNRLIRTLLVLCIVLRESGLACFRVYFNYLSFIDPASSTGNGIYSSFRNRNFWLEYSTPPTTKYPDYDEYYYNYGSTIKTTTPDPGPKFKDVMSNHSLVQVPIGSTAFLHCKVENLRDFQVSCLVFFSFSRKNCISRLQHQQNLYQTICYCYQITEGVLRGRSAKLSDMY